AIGLGIAGNISPDKIRSSANIEYLKNFGLKKFLADRYKAKVALDNDANCFLRAELAFGQASKRDSALAVTLGSGLGGALAYRGEIITGAHNGAGEIGHIPFGRTELEDYASAKFLKKSGNNYRALGQNLSQ